MSRPRPRVHDHGDARGPPGAEDGALGRRDERVESLPQGNAPHHEAPVDHLGRLAIDRHVHVVDSDGAGSEDLHHPGHVGGGGGQDRTVKRLLDVDLGTPLPLRAVRGPQERVFPRQAKRLHRSGVVPRRELVATIGQGPLRPPELGRGRPAPAEASPFLERHLRQEPVDLDHVVPYVGQDTLERRWQGDVRTVGPLECEIDLENRLARLDPGGQAVRRGSKVARVDDERLAVGAHETPFEAIDDPLQDLGRRRKPLLRRLKLGDRLLGDALCIHRGSGRRGDRAHEQPHRRNPAADRYRSTPTPPRSFASHRRPPARTASSAACPSSSPAPYFRIVVVSLTRVDVIEKIDHHCKEHREKPYPHFKISTILRSSRRPSCQRTRNPFPRPAASHEESLSAATISSRTPMSCSAASLRAPAWWPRGPEPPPM